MASLKECRTRFGLKQSDIACKLQKSISEISNYESGIATPDIEEMILMERYFDEQIDWQETVSEKDKTVILNSILTLSHKFPLGAVLSFSLRNLKEGIKIGSPSRFIRHYTSLSDELFEPMLPTKNDN